MVGGASAVGTAMIQLGTAAGANVIAVAGGAEKGQVCKDLGAEPIDYQTEDVFDRVMALTDTHGADVCVDMVGGEGTETIWTCMAREGRYVPVGFNDDPESGLTGRPLRKVSMGNFTIMGVMMGYNDMPVEMRRFGLNTFPPAVGREVHAALCDLVSAGKIRPYIGRVIAMDEVAQALDDHEHRRTSGRTVVNVQGRMTDLRPEVLLAEARAATGLDDFGPDDFREGLAVLCESLERDAHLNDLGDAAFPGMLVGSLSNRLKVVDWIARHPEVADERIERPIVVIGMFRAGTTLLSRLFDQDPRNRGLLMWEAGDSVPPPTPDTHRAGPRVDAVHASNAMLAQINPKIEIVHHEQADEATECITVMAQDFKSLTFEAVANVPGYDRWLMDVDQRSAYEYHQSVLQILQSGGVRGRWTLKSPHHAVALEHLTAVYPDAHLVLLHRDPVVLTASVCSLISTLSSTFTDFDHRAYIAEHWPAMLEESIRRVNTFRDAHPDRRRRRRAVRGSRDRSDRHGGVDLRGVR